MVSRCFPGGYNVKLYISRDRLAWWLLAFLCCESKCHVIRRSARWLKKHIALKIHIIVLSFGYAKGSHTFACLQQTCNIERTYKGYELSALKYYFMEYRHDSIFCTTVQLSKFIPYRISISLPFCEQWYKIILKCLTFSLGNFDAEFSTKAMKLYTREFQYQGRKL